MQVLSADVLIASLINHDALMMFVYKTLMKDENDDPKQCTSSLLN